MPLVCAKAARITWNLAMWPSGFGGGATKENSGDLAGELGRGVVGDALGVVGDWFGCSLAMDAITVGRHGGDKEMRTQQPQCRRGGRTVSERGGGGSSYRAYGRCLEGWRSEKPVAWKLSAGCPWRGGELGSIYRRSCLGEEVMTITHVSHGVKAWAQRGGKARRSTTPTP
jgi:hypothetical protein